MQDRFKFRFWDKETQTMQKSPMIELRQRMTLDTIFNDDRVIFMQSTGLKDKNGKLIYEGDIVKLSSGAIGFIIFECQVYAIRFSKKDKYRRVGLGAYQSKELEIIGNIYENSELLDESFE